MRPVKIKQMETSEFSKSHVKKCLEKVEREYHVLDPAWCIYRLLLQGTGHRFSTNYLDESFVLLKAWGMDSKGARLAKPDVFKRSIIANKDDIAELSRLRIENLDSIKSGVVHDKLEQLFDCLELVQSGKPRFVTFSKAMHFLCPNLVPPMDRKYTLGFFGSNQYALRKGNEKRQFELFIEIMEEYRLLSRKLNLKEFVDHRSRWKMNVPKVCDNIVIGHYLFNQSR